MTFASKLALGFAVLTLGGTALAGDASMDRAAATQASAPAASAPVRAACDCCGMRAAAPAAGAATFTDLG